MFRPYNPYIPKDISEIIDLLSMMMLSAPTFVDKTGYFPRRNIDTVFFELHEGLRLIRKKLGEELYLKLAEMSDKMRAYFDSDPEDKTGDTLKGYTLISEMQDLLKQRARKS